MGTEIAPTNAGVAARILRWLMGSAAWTGLSSWWTPPRGALGDVVAVDTHVDADVTAVADTAQTPQAPTATQIIVQATADLLWAHRNALAVAKHVDVIDRQMAAVTLPGGIVVYLPADTDSWSRIVTPDGAEIYVGREDALPLQRAWGSIQARAVMTLLEIDDPDTTDGDVPNEMPATLIARHLRDAIASPDTRLSEWSTSNGRAHLRGGIVVSPRLNTEGDNAVVTIPGYERMRVPRGPIMEGAGEKTRQSFAKALGLAREKPVYLPLPRGNAQAARVLRLCREAVALDPELADAKGTPIAPLVNVHLPELMHRHEAAAAVARVEDLAGIDAELAEGIERVRAAVDEALAITANARRDALRTQIGFLRLRHPDERDAPLSIDG